ncbi:18463_t:CDS:1, partial [Gigaspora margarita]
DSIPKREPKMEATDRKLLNLDVGINAFSGFVTRLSIKFLEDIKVHTIKQTVWVCITMNVGISTREPKLCPKKNSGSKWAYF